MEMSTEAAALLMWWRIKCHTGDSKRWGWENRQTVVYGGLGGQALVVCFHWPAPLVLHPPPLPPTWPLLVSEPVSLCTCLLLPVIHPWLRLSVANFVPLMPFTRVAQPGADLLTRGVPRTLVCSSTLWAAPHPVPLLLYVHLILCCPLTLSCCAHTHTLRPQIWSLHQGCLGNIT